MSNSENTTTTQNNTSHSSNKGIRNILILILVILIVGLLGILIGLLAFLLNSRNSNQIITTNSNSIITTSIKTTSTTSSETMLDSSSSITNSSVSISNTSTTTSSSISFSHNEGKYIRFDYPGGWKLDVGSKNGDSFNSFDDIAYVNIQKDNNFIGFNFMGGIGCGGGGEWSIDKNNLTNFTNYALDSESEVITTKPINYPIKDFIARKLNLLPVSKNVYLLSFKFTSANNFTYNFNATKGLYRVLAFYDGSKYYNIGCNEFLELDNLNVKSDIKILMVNLSNEKPLDFNYTADVIERFTNSFEKK